MQMRRRIRELIGTRPDPRGTRIGTPPRRPRDRPRRVTLGELAPLAVVDLGFPTPEATCRFWISTDARCIASISAGRSSRSPSSTTATRLTSTRRRPTRPASGPRAAGVDRGRCRCRGRAFRDPAREGTRRGFHRPRSGHPRSDTRSASAPTAPRAQIAVSRAVRRQTCRLRPTNPPTRAGERAHSRRQTWRLAVTSRRGPGGGGGGPCRSPAGAASSSPPGTTRPSSPSATAGPRAGRTSPGRRDRPTRRCRASDATRPRLRWRLPGHEARRPTLQVGGHRPVTTGCGRRDDRPAEPARRIRLDLAEPARRLRLGAAETSRRVRVDPSETARPSRVDGRCVVAARRVRVERVQGRDDRDRGRRRAVVAALHRLGRQPQSRSLPALGAAANAHGAAP